MNDKNGIHLKAILSCQLLLLCVIVVHLVCFDYSVILFVFIECQITTTKIIFFQALYVRSERGTTTTKERFLFDFCGQFVGIFEI